MGRRKKTETATKDTIASAIKYQGKVTVGIQRGNVTLSKKVYHNAGCLPLFRFIANAIGGTYTKADRPCKIALFDGEDTTFATSNILTGAILADTSNPPPELTTQGNGYKTVYHFRIPYAYIKVSSANTKVYKAALFNASPNLSSDTGITNSMYASFEFKEGGNWVPIELPTTEAGNYSLIIEWELSVLNA